MPCPAAAPEYKPPACPDLATTEHCVASLHQVQPAKHHSQLDLRLLICNELAEGMGIS